MIEAFYFDGNSARRHPVTLIMHKGVASMRGPGIARSLRLASFDISERLQHAPRILRFPDGAFIESGNHRRLDKMLAENGYRTPRAVRWQNNWILSLLSLWLVLATLVATWQWGIPAAADTLAQHMPAAIERDMGEQALAALNEEFQPSALPQQEQARLRALFAAMAQPRGEKTPYRLEFRASPLGPNAFALPGGTIVMTDEMVEAAGNDDAVLGVLSHELGHLQRRHAARHVLQTLGMGILLNLWLGDTTSAMAAVPAVLLDQKHSRDFEREADRYAIDMMRANGRPLAPMAALFAHADEHDEEAGEAGKAAVVTTEDEEEAPNYFGSHPSDAERIATLRAADKR